MIPFDHLDQSPKVGGHEVTEPVEGSQKKTCHKIGVPENGWFIVEHPNKMHDLGVAPILGNLT